MKKIIILILLATLTAPAAARGAALEPIDAFTIGQTIVFQQTETIDGGKFKFEDYRGKKILIVAFWLQTCDVCLDQMVRLQEFLDKDGRAKDIEVVTVTRGKSDIERDFVKSMMKRRNVKFKTILDPEILMARYFGTTEIPAYALIDKNGRLAAPVVHYPETKIRDFNLLELADKLRKGEKIPPTQFIPYPAEAELRDMIGKPAPEFTLTSTDGKTYSLPEYKDRMNVMVVFWHPYCTYCWSMMRKMATYYDENRKKYNFVLLSTASIYGFAQEDEAKRFMKESGAKYPILNDADSSVGEKYIIKKMPQVVLIDKNGLIVQIHPGETSNLDKFFTPFLEEMAR